jgi:hypothetical protein
MNDLSRKTCVYARSIPVDTHLLVRIGALLLSLVSIASASSATITVGNASDPVTGTPSKCDVAATCTLRDALSKAANVTGSSAGDTIIFSLPADSTISLSGGELVVDRNLTIDGSASPNLAISGDRHSTVLDVADNVTATLRQLTIKDGHVDYPGGGGGIHNSGTLKLIGSSISDNTAAFGGGIYNDNGNLVLAGSAVSNNVSSFEGGGIWSIGGSLIITDSMVSNNTATLGGGGIYVIYGSATLERGIITANITRNSGGGGIYHSYGDITLTDSAVSGNVAMGENSDGGGGGVYNDEGTMKLVRSTLLNNVSTSVGGGIRNNGIVDVTEGTTVSDNRAQGYQGYGGGICSSGSLTISDSLVSNNMAGVNGGGIVGGDLKIINSAISYNTANGDGGGIASSNLTLIDSMISNNLAGGDGGGIHNGFHGTATLIRNMISGNGSSVNGGGIYNDSYGAIVLIESNTLSNNISGGSGGGIYNYGDYDHSGIVILNNGKISSNTAGDSGGGLYNYTGSLILSGSTISDNIATADGGGIQSMSGNLTSIDGTVSDNTAGGNGGGISTEFGIKVLINSTVSNNAANASGGGIYNRFGILALIHATLAKNTAASGNSDIYNINTSDGAVSVINTIIQSCAVAKGSTRGFADNGGNLDGGSSCGFADASSVSNAMLDLAALADNGGPTLTMMPGANSNAIGSGLASACRDVPVSGRDQRGYVRPAIGCTSGAVDPNGSASDSIFFHGFGFGGQ